MSERLMQKRPAAARPPAEPGRSQKPPSDSIGLDLLAAQAVPVRTRRRQRIPLEPETADTLFAVRSGAFLLAAAQSDDDRQTMAVLLPGDIVRTQQLPPLAGLALISQQAGELLRLRSGTLESLAREDSAVGDLLMRRAALLQARTLLHIAALENLSGEQRLRVLLLELGLRIGHRTGVQILFDVPLGRTEIAEYLALNADTLSRMMSRLRTSGVVATQGRSHVVINDIDALCGTCVFCAAVRKLYES